MWWFSKNHLENDDLANYASFWQTMGKKGMLSVLLFLVAGLACFFVAVFNLQGMPDGPLAYALIGAVLAAGTFGMGAFIYGGCSAGCVAYHAQRRINSLEERIAMLEDQARAAEQPPQT